MTPEAEKWFRAAVQPCKHEKHENITDYAGRAIALRCRSCLVTTPIGRCRGPAHKGNDQPKVLYYQVKSRRMAFCSEACARAFAKAKERK